MKTKITPIQFAEYIQGCTGIIEVGCNPIFGIVDGAAVRVMSGTGFSNGVQFELWDIEEVDNYFSSIT